MEKSALINQVQQAILTKVDSHADIKIIDETHKHQKHKGYIEGKHHFLLEIKSDKLSSMSKISSHKSIYKAIHELMPFIHALSIKIRQE